MKQGLHPLLMIALVAAVTLFGRVLPTWTLSLATVAASNALIALGIVVLARTGNVSFGQGLFFAAGGYGVALIANVWGVTDAVAQMIIGAVCGGLLGLVIGPLIARYSGIFFGMLTLALSMVLYGALVKSTALGGSDGFNVGRPSLFGMSFNDPREADFMLYAVSVITTGFAGIAATILFRSELGLPRHHYQLRYCGDFRRCQRRVRPDGTTAHRSAIRLLDHVRRIRLRSGACGISKRCRRFRRIDGARTGSLVLESVSSQHLAARAWRFPVMRHFVSAPRHRLALDQGTSKTDEANGRDAHCGPKRGSAMKPVLSVRGLDKRFGAVVAADALSIDIAPSQKVSLIGANGAGKTTFVNMVTGYLKPDSGSIELDGMDIGRRSPRHVARLGISRSFQIPQLFIELTAAENLAVAVSGARAQALSFHSPAEAQGRRDKALELLARFGLTDVADRPILELAGGVRKLVDIAMALVRRPKLLLLDEPTSGVSAEEKFATMDRVIHAIAPDAATIVFVEHDMEIVGRYADRVVAFYQGRILADGNPHDVLKDPEVRRYVTGGAQ